MLNKIIKFGMLFLLVSACGSTHSNSSLSLTNARLAAEDEYISVVKIRNLVNGRFCAGTFIAEGLVLTTAHCVYGTKSDIGTSRNTSMVIASDQNISSELKSVGVHSHPAWSEQIGYANPFDIAIVEFPDANSIELSHLATKPIRAGMQAVLVGFGARQAQGQLVSPFGNEKQIGKNQILQVSRGLITLGGAGKTTITDGTANDSLAVAGDSGSPLFVDGQLAGISITSGSVGNSKNHQSQIIYLQSEFVAGYINSFL